MFQLFDRFVLYVRTYICSCIYGQSDNIYKYNDPLFKLVLVLGRGSILEICQNIINLLIHEADPKSQPVVITILTRGVCPSVRLSLTFHNIENLTKFHVRIVIATGGTVSLAEKIIDNTNVLCSLNFIHFIFKVTNKHTL